MLLLSCSNTIILGDAICELIDLCYSGVYAWGVLEILSCCSASDASVSESNFCETESHKGLIS